MTERDAPDRKRAWTQPLKRMAAYVAGPIVLIIAGFVLAGGWGLIIGMFIAMAAVVFVPLFAILQKVSGATGLVGLVAIANVIPLMWWAINCPLVGNACPNYSWQAASPMYVGATVCAVIFWWVRRRWGSA